MVLGDECLDPYLISYRLGCQLTRFEHVFHTNKPTGDVLGGNKQNWLTSQHEDRTASMLMPKDKNRETQSKIKSNRHLSQHEVDDFSDRSTGSSGTVEDDEDLANEPVELSE